MGVWVPSSGVQEPPHPHPGSELVMLWEPCCAGDECKGTPSPMLSLMLKVQLLTRFSWCCPCRSGTHPGDHKVAATAGMETRTSESAASILMSGSLFWILIGEATI